MKIGLLGFGTVGEGVYELTKQQENMMVARVLCRKDRSLPDAAVTHDFADILQDETIDTVVEVIGGLHPAYEYVTDAIRAGKNIVTANKALMAVYYDELLALAAQHGVSIRCTAAVGGGIGWLSALERARRVDTLREIHGIMNGTCNYILDSMTRLGLDYAEALRRAQELGYAEAEPSTDVDGIDTWHKLILSANIAFGVSLEKADVPVAGIRNITYDDIGWFNRHGYVCKLVGTARRDGEAHVQPTLYALSELEGNIPANFNLISLDGEVAGRQSFYGQGAGRYPTALNVVQDCADLLEGKGFYCPCGGKTAVPNRSRMVWYVRAPHGPLPEGPVSEQWGEGKILEASVAEMHRWLKDHPDAFIAAIPDRVK